MVGLKKKLECLYYLFIILKKYNYSVSRLAFVYWETLFIFHLDLYNFLYKKNKTQFEYYFNKLIVFYLFPFYLL